MPGLGELCALLAPLSWSAALILYKRSSALPAPAITFFKNAIAFVLISATMVVMGVGLPDRSGADWARVIGSGVLGLAVADTLLFAGLRRIGAARLAVADTIYAPTVVLLAWAFLGERLDPSFLAGAVAVLGGVALASIDPAALRTRPSRPGEVAIGMLLALTAIVGTATGVVLVRPVLQTSDLIEVNWSRLAAGFGAQALFVLISGQREALIGFRPSPVWKTLIPAALLGTYVSLLLWLAGFKWAPASTAAVLNQIGTVYLLLLARYVLKEELKPRQVVGGLLAACGAVWIVVGPVLYR